MGEPWWGNPAKDFLLWLSLKSQKTEKWSEHVCKEIEELLHQGVNPPMEQRKKLWLSCQNKEYSTHSESNSVVFLLHLTFSTQQLSSCCWVRLYSPPRSLPLVSIGNPRQEVKSKGRRGPYAGISVCNKLVLSYPKDRSSTANGDTPSSQATPGQPSPLFKVRVFVCFEWQQSGFSSGNPLFPQMAHQEIG